MECNIHFQYLLIFALVLPFHLETLSIRITLECINFFAVGRNV